MKRRGGLAVLVAAAGMVALGGCQDSTVGPDETQPDAGLAMSFSEGGQYQADGLPSFDGSDVAPGTFAVAFADSIGGLVMTGFSKTMGTRGDLFILQLLNLRAGDFGPCSIVGGGGCHGRLLEDIDAAKLQDVGATWEIVDGSVQVDNAGPDRVSGSFSGLMLESRDGTATRTVDGGTFDLPLLSDAEGSSIMRCFLARVTGASSCGS